MAALSIWPSGPAPRRQLITTISGSNLALPTDSILAVFLASEVMVHRSVAKRLPLGPFVVPAGPGADRRRMRGVKNSLTGYRDAAVGGDGALAVPRQTEADPKPKYVPLNQM